MSSVQSVAPIIATALYTSVYNATSDLAYPWASSYLFLSGCLFILSKSQNKFTKTLAFSFLGGLLPFTVYASLGFKQIPPVEENEQHEDSKVEA